jgi:Leucine-rich repeat (LRR) protein
MAATPRLQRLSEADLDALIADLRRQGTRELVLLSPGVRLPASVDQWPQDLQDKTRIYQLIEPVEALAERLGELTQLTSLDLRYNQIGDAGAASLAALTQLTSLDLGGNQIGAAGAASLAALTQLTCLNLDNNQIGDAGAASLAALKQLTSLDLWGNKIGAAGAASLAALTQLTSLNLSYNKIGAAGAASLAALTQLTCLDLGGNQIGDAGAASLAALTQLTCLNLDNNQIGDAGAASLAALKQLTSLDLWGNKIGAAGAASLAALKQLTSLELWGNKIGAAGAASLAALKQLTSLNLGYNKIGDEGAASLAALTQLTSLNLENNEIGDAGAAALAALTQLTSLDLSYNPVVDSTPFSTMRRLTSLNLKETKIQDLSSLRPLLERGLEAKWQEYEFENGINVYNCPLIHPPPEIIQQGQEAVLNYLREIDKQGVDHLYEAKVLILGEGGAGKTSLLRRLYQTTRPLPAEEESTKGIDIHRHEFANREGRPFRLNVWDFGGQQIYHATHQFFLTKRSLYILVDDTRNNSKTVHDEGFKYWLEVIETLSERSPVLIFQNEKAGRSKSIAEAGIKGRFPNVIEVYRGNLEKYNAANNLEEAIRLHVQKLPHVGDAVPAQWVTIRSELEKIKEGQPFISQKDYFQLYASYLEEDRPKALRLSQYFHDLGVFLHFQDDQLLQRYVILQNDWATEAVFKVLDDEPTKARKGRFTQADCQRIWAHSTYADMHPELLALMVKFELCYKLPDQRPATWLSPQLLSPSAPELFKDWAKPDDLVLFFQYDFLPKGMISRLMVRKNHLARQPDLCWVDGAYFQHGGSDLLVSLMESGQEIELRARGPERKELISVIASDLDALNASFEGLRDKVRKFVPCICSNCRLSTTPESYEEGKLLKRKHDGKLTIECPESYEDVSVLELLDGLKLDMLPQWDKPAQKEPPGADDRHSVSTEGSVSPPLRMIKIFLASSSELKEDRDGFELHFLRKNKDYSRQGFKVEVLRWENFLDAMSETRLQEEYNEEVRNCDIFVSLFKTKTGKYTEEEFDAAHRAFKDSGKPLIYTYFMKNIIPTDKRLRRDLISLWNFQDKLSGLGHYHTHYTSIEDLKLQFQQQLGKLIEEGKL